MSHHIKVSLWLLMLVSAVPVMAQNTNTAIFTGAPGVAATDSDLLVAKNSAQTTLQTAINVSDTQVTLVNPANFIAPMSVSIENEILKCTAKSNTSPFTLTCSRGFDGTVAVSHASGVTVSGYIIDWHHNQLAAEVKAIEGNVPTKAPKISPVFTGTVDSSGASHTLPSAKGTIAGRPSLCTIGEEYFATDAAAGQNKYYCTATNTWTQQSGTGGGGGAVSSVFGRSGAISASTGDYTVGQVTGAAPLVSPTFIGTFNASGATHTLPSVKGITASRPATCTIGEQYFATDATAGQNLYFCTATNTWTQQISGGGTGAVSSVFGRSGTVVATGGDYTVSQVTGAAPIDTPTFTGILNLNSSPVPGGMNVNLTDGWISPREPSTGIVEMHIRAKQGKTAILSFTEDNVVDRWSIKSLPGDGTLYYALGYFGSTNYLFKMSPTGNFDAVSFSVNGAATNTANGLCKLDGSGLVPTANLPASGGGGGSSSGQVTVYLPSSVPVTQYDVPLYTNGTSYRLSASGTVSSITKVFYAGLLQEPSRYAVDVDANSHPIGITPTTPFAVVTPTTVAIEYALAQ